MTLVDDVTAALDRVTDELPGGGERREGQRRMAAAVAAAIDADRHLVVQAGTGTGKSLAYLVPAILSDRTTVVVTATKALQDQLVGKDLPFLEAHLDQPVRFAMLKGRSNYLCRQRVSELVADDQLALDGVGERASARDLERLLDWAEETETGDRAELAFEPSHAAWGAVSVGLRECPGATKCPKGETCLAELARREAAAADVIVVNTHLYGAHLASGGMVLPEHEVVVFDEAHQLEDTIAATSGYEISPGRFRALARSTRAILADDDTVDALEAAAGRLADVLGVDVGRRIRGRLDDELGAAVLEARARSDAVIAALRKVPADGPGDVATRRDRAMLAATSLIDDLDAIVEVPKDKVAWIEGPPASASLRVAPIDVSELLADGLWGEITAVLTSATIPANLTVRVGLTDHVDQIDVGSPFDFEHHAVLYCAAHLPDPRQPGHAEALQDELAALIEAAGGRTLALFTSWRAMDDAAEALADRLATPILTQRDLPKPALLRAFTDDPATSLFATMGFWQGVDVPGESLTLVTIDRLPFPRPDDPLIQARRELARAEAFRAIDLPRAATLLAQGAGRLIRSGDDRGVVAVLDSRLATASYRWDIVNALPPMRRTKDRDEVHRFLAEITASSPRSPLLAPDSGATTPESGARTGSSGQ